MPARSRCWAGPWWSNATTSTGAFTAASGTTLQFGGGTHDLQAGSSVSGAGTVDFNAGVVNVNGTYNVTGSTTATGAALTMNPTAILTSLGTNVSVSGGTVTLNSGEALSATTLSLTGGTLGGNDSITVSGATTWSGGTMTGAGTTVAQGGLTINGTGAKTLSGGRILEHQGTGSWTGSGAIVFGAGASTLRIASGIFTVGDASTNQNTISSLARHLEVLSGATLQKSSGGTTNFITGVSSFTNAGTVKVLEGTLSFGSNVFNQTAGLTELNGGNLTATGTLSLNGGTLRGNGTVTTTTLSNNGGTVGPGFSPGTLTITGAYTQGAGGTLNIEIGGTTTADYDRLLISGATTLNGALIGTVINGFTPAFNDTFTFMTFGSRSGDFATRH